MKQHADQTQTINDEFVRRKMQLRIAPGPSGDDVPEWTTDGIEELPEFFNSTADIWDQKFGAKPNDPFYHAVALQIPQTDEPIEILDLGCGTGIQLEFVFARAPNAKVTAIDRAPNMLKQLRAKFANKTKQLRLQQGSLLEIPFGHRAYDYAISTLTMHHFLPERKVTIYRKVREALRTAGIYVEGDQATTVEEEKSILYWYNRWIAKLPGGDRAEWNYDITLSPGTQARILREAGFSEVQLAWHNPSESAVYVAKY
jgi:tRNA (cmo5U34)-methyltransferase